MFVTKTWEANPLPGARCQCHEGIVHMAVYFMKEEALGLHANGFMWEHQ
jgi:hypothetical protein